MEAVVSPVDHKFPPVAEEVNTTDPPAQNVVGPAAVIVGVEGRGVTVTVVAELTGLVHPFPSVI